ncbi:MAG: flavodoxin [Bacillus sp. (in: firmicutes)]
MKVLIGFASMSGNTEEIMVIIKTTLEGKECTVDSMEIDTIEAASLGQYDLILLGSYTWGDGDLPYEVEDFYDELDAVTFPGIPAACFGSGDTDYPEYCKAVELLAEKLKERGLDVFEQLLKVELSPDTEEEVAACEQFASSLYEWAKMKEISNVQ